MFSLKQAFSQEDVVGGLKKRCMTARLDEREPVIDANLDERLLRYFRRFP